MCLFGSTITNTTIHTGNNSFSVYSHDRYTPYGYGLGSFSPGCFGYGFGNGYGFGLGNNFGNGFGNFNNYAFSSMGLGFAAGMSLGPSILKGIGKACSWTWNSVLAPACKGVWNGIKWAGQKIGQGASWLWNKAIAPAGKWVWNGIKYVGNAIGKGCKNLWNNIFHKNKTKEA